MYVTVYSDSNDIEGLVLQGHLGTEYVMRANGQLSSPKFQMAGRPIGFGIYMGTGGTQNQPLRMSIMYNSCNCPASTFFANQQPVDMTITAVTGSSYAETLAYQGNYMEYTYNQDCGSYSVTLSPTLAYLTVTSNGSTGGFNNHAFPDTMTLSAPSIDQIGQHTVTMTVLQSGVGSEGYTSPQIGQMPSIQYTFLVTVDPCDAVSLTVTNATPTINYTIGQGLSQEIFGADFSEQVTCGYTKSAPIVSGEPTFVSVNSANESLDIQTADKNHAGTYTISVSVSFDQPDDYTKSTFTTHSNTITYTLIVTDLCPPTTFSVWNIPDVTTYVHDLSPATQDALIPTDLVSLANGNNDGYTLCGSRTLTMTSPNLSFLTFNGGSSPHLSAQTTNNADHGSYTINLQIQLDNYPSITATTSVTLHVIDRCQTTSFSTWSIPDMTAYVKDALPATQDALIPSDTISLANGNSDGYTFCGPRSLTMTSSALSFLTFDPTTTPHLSAQTNDITDAASYTVTLQVQLDNYPSITQTVSLTLNVIDRCASTTFNPWTIPTMTVYINDVSPAIQNALVPPNSVSLAQGNQNGYDFCGLRTLTMTSNAIPFLTTNFVIIPKNLSAQTTNILDKGTYTIDLYVELDDYPSISQTTSFTMNVIDRCDTTVFSPWTIPDMTTYVKDALPATQDALIPSDTVSLAHGNSDGYTFCGPRSLTMTSSALPFLTFNPTTSPHLSAITTNINDHGTYSLSLQIQLDNYPSITQTVSLTLNVIDQCLSTTFSVWNVPDMTTYVYDWLPVTQDALIPSDSVSLSNKQNGNNFCGPRTLTMSSTALSFLTFNPTTSPHLSAQSFDINDAGTYSITLVIQLDNYPQITKSDTHTLYVIDRCVSTAFSTWSIPDMTIYVKDALAVDQDALIPTDTVSLAHGNQNGYSFCGSRTLTMTSQTLSFLTFDSVNSPHLSAITSNIIDHGVYTVTLQIQLDTYPSITQTISFTLNVIDRCQTTSFSSWTIPDMTTYVKDALPATQNALFPSDIVSLAYGNSDGYTFCGSRTLTMTSQNLSFLTFDPTSSPHLSAQTTDITDHGSYTITLQIQLDTYPSITATTSITLNVIDRCVTTILSSPWTIPNMTTYVKDALPATQDALIPSDLVSLQHGNNDGFTFCGPRTLTMTSQIHPFFTFNPTTSPHLSAQTNDISTDGTYTITLQVVLDTYPLILSTTTLQLQIIDRCMATVIQVNPWKPMYSFVTGPQDSQDFQLPQDTISQQFGDQSGLTFCGTRTVSITNAATIPNFSNFASFDGQYYNFQTNDDADVGEYILQTEIVFADYPQMTINDSFKLVIDWCQVSTLTSIQPIKQEYTVGEPALTISWVDFLQTPSSCAYTLDYQFRVMDLGAGSTDLLPTAFVQHNFQTKTFTVETSDSSYRGNYKLKVVGSVPLDRMSPIKSHELFIELEIKGSPQITVSPNQVDYIEPLNLIDIPDFVLNGDESLEVYIGDEFYGEFGDQLDIMVILGDAEAFAVYDPITKTIRIDKSMVTSNLNGDYIATIELSYQNTTYSEEYTEEFNIKIDIPDPEPPTYVGKTVALEFPQPEEKKITSIRTSQRMGPYNPKQPIPFIQSLSEAGMLTIGWDKDMVKPTNSSEIRPSKVGIAEVEEPPDFTKLNEIGRQKDLRQLSYRYHDWFQNETAYVQWMMVVDALEIKVEPGPYSDQALLNLTSWNLLDFSKQFIWIQLEFEFPDHISEAAVQDDISVTFWGTEFFQANNGEEVRFGTNLKQTIYRQIDPEIAGNIGVAGHYASNALAALMAISFGCALVGGEKLLPTWMFLNSFQLILHLPLFEIPFPPNALYFYKQNLNMIRLNSFGINQLLAKLLHSSSQNNSSQQTSTILDRPSHQFVSLGYESTDLVENCGIFILIIALCILIFIICQLKDKMCAQNRRNRLSKEIVVVETASDKISNILVRVLYQSFFELCLCSLLYLKRHGASIWNESSMNNQFTVWTLLSVLCLLVLFLIPLWAHKQFLNSTSLANKADLDKFWKQRQKKSKKKQFVQKSSDLLKNQIAIIADNDAVALDYALQEDNNKSRFWDRESKQQIFEHKNGGKDRDMLEYYTKKGVSIRNEDISIRSDQNLIKNVQDKSLIQQYYYEGGQQIIESAPKKIYLVDIQEEILKHMAEDGIRREKLTESLYPTTHKTLFYGLKPCTKPDDSFDVARHLQLYFWRRIFFAILALFLSSNFAMFGVLLLSMSCLLELGLLKRHGLWKDQLIRYQHAFNEILLYFLCIQMVYFSAQMIDGKTLMTHGYFLIFAICLFCTINVTIIAVYNYRYLRLVIQRRKQIIKHQQMVKQTEQLKEIKEEPKVEIVFQKPTKIVEPMRSEEISKTEKKLICREQIEEEIEEHQSEMTVSECDQIDVSQVADQKRPIDMFSSSNKLDRQKSLNNFRPGLTGLNTQYQSELDDSQYNNNLYAAGNFEITESHSDQKVFDTQYQKPHMEIQSKSFQMKNPINGSMSQIFDISKAKHLNLKIDPFEHTDALSQQTQNVGRNSRYSQRNRTASSRSRSPTSNRELSSRLAKQTGHNVLNLSSVQKDLYKKPSNKNTTYLKQMETRQIVNKQHSFFKQSMFVQDQGISDSNEEQSEEFQRTNDQLDFQQRLVNNSSIQGQSKSSCELRNQGEASGSQSTFFNVGVIGQHQQQLYSNNSKPDLKIVDEEKQARRNARRSATATQKHMIIEPEEWYSKN